MGREGAITVLYILAVFWRGVDPQREGNKVQVPSAGEHDPSDVFHDEKLSNSLHVSIERDPGKYPTVTATFSFEPPSVCLQGHAYNYTIITWTRGNVLEATEHVKTGPFTSSSCNGLIKIPVEKLERDVSYSACVTVYSRDSIRLRSNTVQFRTNDVQQAAVIMGERHMKIMCRFAKGSVAKGCHIVIEYVNTYTSVKLDVNTLNVAVEDASFESSTCVELESPASLSRIRVYDWLKDGTVGSVAVIPIFKKGSDSVCDLESKKSLSDTSRVTLFYASAVLMAAGIIVITIGMLCKLGRLNSHFKKYSHAPIENAGDHSLQSKLATRIHHED